MKIACITVFCNEKFRLDNWKSYFSAIKDYKKNPSKYLGCPRPPKYKNNNDKKMKLSLLI